MSVKAFDYDVLVVGAGFAGMYAIYRFRQAGLKVRVLEAGTDVGGTWYWNRYPGARCDVPSLEYSFGFSPELEQEWDWPEVFSAQPDILAYANHVADRFNLRDNITFNTRVVAADYIGERRCWRLTTADNDVFEAPFCVMATGCLSVPNTPELVGADTFAGEVYHTGRWPHEGVDLAGKRVGILGTGSSAVQAIPELAQQAEHLFVLQRSPVYTVPANRKAMRAENQAEFRLNYRDIRRMQQENPGGVSNYRPGRGANKSNKAIELTGGPDDGQFVGSGRGAGGNLLDLSPEQRERLVSESGLEILLSFRDVYTDVAANELANELYRRGVQELVNDPATADGLLPQDYGFGCKRQVLDRDYYATFNRDNVTLINLQKDALESLTADGVQTQTQQIELDVFIYATGFDAMTGALLRANITGQNGLRLEDKWADGPVTYLGLQVAGFPNLFTVTGPGSPSVLCNMLVAIEQHINWIADCITHLRSGNYASIAATDQAEHDWVKQVNDVAEGTMYTTANCNSWYLGANIPGKTRVFMPYVGGYARYRKTCEQVVADGYAGFQLEQNGKG